MSRQRFLALSQGERDAWTVRLHQQLGVALNTVANFWFDGELVTEATVYKRDAQGLFIREGREPATEHVVPLAYIPGSITG